MRPARRTPPAAPATVLPTRTARILRGARALGRARAASPARSRGPARTTHPDVRAAVPAAALLGAHTYAVTAVSRHEAQGGSTVAPLGALAAIVALGAAAVREQRDRGVPPVPGKGGPGDHHRSRPGAPAPRLLLTALTTAYLRTAAKPLLHATLNPSPPLTQRAVGGGIRAMIPLQAVLAARAGASGTGLAVMGLVPLARTLARKVSLT